MRLVGDNTIVADSTVQIPTRGFVVGMMREDGSLHAEELFDVAENFGLSAEQVRSCLRRLVAEGIVTRQGSGRTAVYQSTDAVRSEFDRQILRTRLAHTQDLAGRGWDSRWRLAAFTVPESQRSVRDEFRSWLLSMGATAIHGGLYVSPHPFLPLVADEAERLGITRYLVTTEATELVVGGERDPRRLAAELWPLAKLAAAYQGFVDEFSHVPEELEKLRARHDEPSEPELMAQLMTLGMRYGQTAIDDPYLPPELLPRPWPGRAARLLMNRTHRVALLMRASSHRPNILRVFDEVVAELN